MYFLSRSNHSTCSMFDMIFFHSYLLSPLNKISHIDLKNYRPCLLWTCTPIKLSCFLYVRPHHFYNFVILFIYLLLNNIFHTFFEIMISSFVVPGCIPIPIYFLFTLMFVNLFSLPTLTNIMFHKKFIYI